MRVVCDFPPNFAELDRVFGIGNKPVVFAWGQTIYRPNGGKVSASILAHEAVHGHQQGDDIPGWWRRYIDDPAFRLEQEIPAHRAEYLVLIDGVSRQVRRNSLRIVAKKLAGPLYGGLITPRKAKMILEAA